MIKQVQSKGFAAVAGLVLPVGMLLLAGIQTADAKQCRATMPSSPQGHWTYRLIDGRKCWYEGASKISKALLQWPAPAQIRSERSRRDDKRLGVEAPTVSKNTGAPNNRFHRDQCCNKHITESESFEARWQPLDDAVHELAARQK
jgi:hypothetical protein